MKSQIEIANQNVKLYVFIKIFAKRVFLPLSVIYFVDQVGFSLQEIGILAMFYSLINTVAEIPTGYFADKVSRVVSIRIGALLNTVSTLAYVFAVNKTWIFTGQLFEAIGYAFIAGAGEALIHDSLVTKNQENNYSKILSRTQSVSLLLNAGIIALVPMTYKIDPRLPFLLGTVAYFILFIFALFMRDVNRQVFDEHTQRFSIGQLLTKRHVVYFGILFGIISALYIAPNDMQRLTFRELGVKPEFLGWIYAVASIIGSIIGSFIHLLKNLRLKMYLLIDSVVLLLPFISAYSRSLPFLIVTFLINMSFWRYRKIIYQNYLLEVYPTKYKATLLSAMNNLEQVNLIWLPMVVAFVVSKTSLTIGLGLIGLCTLVLIPFYITSTLVVLTPKTASHN